MICKLCHDAVVSEAEKRGYTLTTQDVHEILVNATCYPCGCVENVAPQVAEFFDGAENGQPSLEELFARADERFSAEMKEAMRA